MRLQEGKELAAILAEWMMIWDWLSQIESFILAEWITMIWDWLLQIESFLKSYPTISIFVITALISSFAWIWNERAKRFARDYRQKENRYRDLIIAMGTESERDFRDALNLS